MTSPITSPVSYTLNDGIATLTLDDGKANAMNPRMPQAINDAASGFCSLAPLGGRAGVRGCGMRSRYAT